MRLPPIPAAAWQVGLGCFPIVIIGLAFETTHIDDVTQLGWWLLVYSTVIQFCIAYVGWFAALARLPASIAAIGTMAVSVIGVVASAVALGEPLGLIPDRGAGVYAGGRRAGDAVLASLALSPHFTSGDQHWPRAEGGKGDPYVIVIPVSLR